MSTPSTSSVATRARDAVLRARLDRIVARASGHIARVRGRRAAASAAERAVRVFAAGAAVLLAWQVLLRLFGYTPARLGWLLFVAPLAALAFILARGARARTRASTPSGVRLERAEALAAMDGAMKSDERLQTADEFSAAPERTPFMDAAIADAEPVIVHALSAEPLAFAPRWRPDRRQGAAIAAGFVLLIAAALLGRWSPGAGPDSSDSEVAVAPEPAATDAGTGDSAAEPPEVPEPERSAADPRPPAIGGEQSAERKDSDPEAAEDAKESQGKTGTGRSADAQAASGRSESRGAPSNQSQTSTPPPKKKKPQERPAGKKKAPKEAEPRERKSEEQSGATAGRGSSRGSSRNPAVSTWSSKDQVAAQEEVELEDDEEAEDEEEDQEARGGVQPNLRDRKPPTSRDLNIGFGNQKNPDANGRGGPSQPKKSRGTASLVLGVPIPDRVKGQPNPGRNKVTQERIEPRPEDSESTAAAARRPRAEPVGRVGRPDLLPWMRDLVRAYFIHLHEQQPDKNGKGRP